MIRSRLALLVVVLSSASVDAWSAQVSVAGSTFKVRANQPALPFTSVSMSAARNEFEGFQILVTGQASAITATATSLSNGSFTIPAPRLFREALINLANTSAPDGWTGLTSDGMVPDVDEIDGQRRRAFTQPGFTWTVPAGQTQAIWGEVLVPGNAPAGTFTGSVTVRFNEGTQTVPVTLTVYGFSLPAVSSLKSAFGLNYGGTLAGWGIPCCGPEQSALRAKFDKLGLDHKISLSVHDEGIVTTGNFNTYYGPYVAGTGPTQVSQNALTNVQCPAGLTDTNGMRAWFDNFTAHGWPNILFQYTCDEPPQTCAWSDIPPRARAAKNANASFRTLVTTNIAEANANGVTSSVDLLVPVINHMDDKPGQRFAGNQRGTYDGFLAGGPLKQLWLYQSCMSHGCGGTSSYFTGWPSYMIDATASRNRAMQWLAYKYHVTGELYWETTHSFSGDPWSNQWDPTFAGNGDGNLFHRGTPSVIGGTTNIPVASFRLKMIREGYEDYEYLKLLTDLGDGAMAQQETDALFPNAYTTDVDPARIMAARDRIASRIVALVGGGGGGGGPAGPRYDGRVTAGVTIDGNLGEFAAAPAIALSGAYAGTSDTAQVKLMYDDQYLYASFGVTDGELFVNQGGRDGEVWNGDGVELMIDVANDKSAAPNANDYHILINVNGDVTDERGTASGTWDRSWTSSAAHIVARTSTGYSVEVRVPWTSMGASPCAGALIGLDVATNDVQAAGQAPKPYDWSQLTRFAQPSLWGNLSLSAVTAGMTYVVQQAFGTMTVDGNLSELARAYSIDLSARAAATGSDNQPKVRLLYDSTYLYAGFKVLDGTFMVNQGGRDGEVWNGDSIELMLDTAADRSTAQDSNDYHLLVNFVGDLTDERGNAGTWDRTWTSSATVAVARIAGGYTVEMAIPWVAMGLAAPAAGTSMGLDVANNDTDTAGSVLQFDWAGLTRFAQPSLWGWARFAASVPACSGSATPPPAW